MHLAGQDLLITEEKLTASRHLSNLFLSMCRRLQEPVSCPICLYIPEGEAIERAMCVRQCGHIQSCSCLLGQMETDDSTCWICRQ